MDETTLNALKTVAFLLGVVISAMLVMIGLLIVSLFHEVSLQTAFTIQFLSGCLGGMLAFWRVS